jgi:MoaA/NifB/PqqE/SkfB family radical SAM enzyme
METSGGHHYTVQVVVMLMQLCRNDCKVDAASDDASILCRAYGRIDSMKSRLLPERLNLAIARRCEVACPGCYTNFGRSEPALAKFLPSIATFVRLGLDNVTLSGGDPLTIAGVLQFIADMKTMGVRSTKFDTVGVGLAKTSPPRVNVRDLAVATDYIGVPLDGWSNESVLEFRRGRPQLFTETIELLDALDRLSVSPIVIVHTVVHAGNISHLEQILEALAEHSCVLQWNIFQYTPTDQATQGANQRYFVSDEKFEQCRERLLRLLPSTPPRLSFRVNFQSNRSRLGQYLLVNSDGEAWLPDEGGRTLLLGSVFGREERVLDNWSDAAAALQRRSGFMQAPLTFPDFAGT